ncbi:PilN domain-containing protein [Deferribacter thermophilus]|uniref:PilN domain-containing protein n=1 Tax=Deferribacter thermophilus TaxID=53573 RepID=UPI003C1946DB
MSFKKIKKLNIIPENLRYDIIKDYIIKLSFFTLILTILIIIFDYSMLYYKNGQLEKMIKNLSDYNSELKKEISSLDRYEKQYDSLKNELQKLLKEKKEIYTFYSSTNSPLISTVFYLTSKPDDIFFQNVSYKNNLIYIEGITKNAKSFYRYYHSLENNKLLKNIDFNFIKKDESSSYYNFKIIMRVKDLDEIN